MNAEMRVLVYVESKLELQYLIVEGHNVADV